MNQVLLMMPLSAVEDSRLNTLLYRTKAFSYTVGGNHVAYGKCGSLRRPPCNRAPVRSSYKPLPEHMHGVNTA
jgi:hypothetical protein